MKSGPFALLLIGLLLCASVSVIDAAPGRFYRRGRGRGLGFLGGFALGGLLGGAVGGFYGPRYYGPGFYGPRPFYPGFYRRPFYGFGYYW